MFELILHHNYKLGEVVDLSGNGNDARSTPGQVRERIIGEKALYFNGTTDRIIVPPSETLNPLGGIRARVWIWLEELEQRRNILEGYLSFALYVDPDGALCASVYNGSRWPHLRSAPNTIPLQQWICVTYVYDGIDTSVLYLNNILLAQKYGYFRKMQGIQWPFGLNIGAWPDADSYMFKGEIAEVKIWRSI